MGIASSGMGYTDITNNEGLHLFSSELEVSDTDPFWESFLTFTLKPPITREADEEFTSHLTPIYKLLLGHSPKSGNYATLINYICTNATINELVPSTSTVDDETSRLARCRLFNALFIARCFLKYLVEHCDNEELQIHFETPAERIKNEGRDTDDGIRKYIETLVNLIINIPAIDQMYEINLEAVNSLLVLLSSPLTHPTTSTSQLSAYRIIMNTAESSNLLKALLQRYIDQGKYPVKTSSGIFNGIAYVWSFITFRGTDEEELVSPLASRCVLLMLLLINNNSSLSSNPYRKAISSYTANVNGLYDVLCSTIKWEENTLLLYHLLHCNINFKNYLLARSDVELMLLPILKRIYKESSNNCHHMYMSLIILLILTEDQLFNKTVHNMMLKGIPWYTERIITEISLGGLIVLVASRTIQHNLLRMRDKYLHTNCLAALANMSSQFVNLHPYVCQRLISLFEMLTKTYSRANSEAMAVEEAIRIVLEVINSCLTHQLIHNPNLVYTLLYNKQIFQPIRNHEAFHDIIQNIDLVITYFSKKLEKEEPSTDVNEILEKVQQWSLQWPKDLLKKFPDLKFKYIEEEKPEEFFIPYVWSLIGKYSNIFWDSSFYRL